MGGRVTMERERERERRFQGEKMWVGLGLQTGLMVLNRDLRIQNRDPVLWKVSLGQRPWCLGYVQCLGAREP